MSEKVTPLKFDMSFEQAFSIYAMLLIDGKPSSHAETRARLLAEGRLFDRANKAMQKLIQSRNDAVGEGALSSEQVGLELQKAIAQFEADMAEAMQIRIAEGDEIGRKK